MKRVAELLTAVVLAAATPLCAASTAPLAQQPWSGAAVCRIEAKGPGYRDQQTHTWTLSGGAPNGSGAIQVHPATWSVSGSGEFASNQSTLRLIGEWNTAGQAYAPFAIGHRRNPRSMAARQLHRPGEHPRG